MGGGWWWVRSSLVLGVGAPLLLYAALFLRSMFRHGWELDHLTVLLFVWQTQTSAAFALLAALVGAWVLYHQGEARWHRERATLVAALLAEVTSILRTYEEQKFDEMRQIMQQAMRGGESLSGATAPTFRDMVYEKSTDRIGMLTTDDAADVVQFYGFVTGVRNAVNRAYDASLPIQDRISSLDILISDFLPETQRRGVDLQRKLEATVVRLRAKSQDE
jgi:hypothetical protein